MKVVITGGGGFLGRRLGGKLLDVGRLTGSDGQTHSIDRIALFDTVEPAKPLVDPRVSVVTGDIGDPEVVRGLIDNDTASVFHFAGVVSAGAEEDFDLGYRVNLDGTRHVLEACRALPHSPRVVFTSSIAAYGGEYTIEDRTPLTPRTSYGTQKVMGELMLADFTRKGYLDGRALRLPTIVVRPGKPNKAASTFASSIIREPLQGQQAICPVKPESRMPLLSPRRVTEAFVHAHELDTEALGPVRSVLLDGISPRVGEMVDALRSVAGDNVASRVVWQPDEMIQRIVDGWPQDLHGERSGILGFRKDSSVEEMISAFVEEELGGQIAA